MKKKKETRGGYRENAKRPLKYGEPTVTVNYRVPASQRLAVNDLVKKFLKKYLDFVTQIQN
jgi:hypothetical protein